MDELELALDDCLQRLSAGKSSLAQCLARYPGHAAELRPMLEAAIQVQRGKEVRPSGSVRDRTRSKLLAHIEAHPRQPRKMRVVPRLAFVLIALVIGLLAAGTGAAQAAMPGEPLYSLKLTSEQAWRAANPDPVGADLFLANRRCHELVVLANKPAFMPLATGISQADAESQVIAAYSDVLDRLDKETTQVNVGNVLQELQAHENELSKAGVHVPKLDDILAREHHPNNQGQGDGNGNGSGHGNNP